MSVQYNGDHSIDFFKLDTNEERGVCNNSWLDLYLIPSSRPYYAVAQPNYKYSAIPLSNRRVDTTDSYLEGIIYGARSGQWEFFIDHDKWPDWETGQKKFIQYFDGGLFAFRLADDSDIERIYQGRVIFDSYQPAGDYSKLTVQYVILRKYIDFGSLYFIVKYYDWDGTPISSEAIPWGGSPSFPGGSGSWGGGGSSGGGSGAGHSNGYYIKIGPAKIEIIEEPNRHIYVDGEIVDYTGIVVQVIDTKGEPWTNDGNFPNGILPINPSQLPRITAHRHDGIEQDVYVNWVKSGVKFSDFYTIRVYANEKAAIIKIVDPMIKKFYVEGDTIDYVGMSVAIYDKHKDEWAREAYPDGRVPQNELILQSKAYENPNSAYVDIPVQWISPDNDLLSTSTQIIVGNIVHNRQYLSSTFSIFDGTKVIEIKYSEAFKDCVNLKEAAFPVCSWVGRRAFINCSSLTEVSFPLCNYIELEAFAYCSSISKVYFPLCSFISNSAFYNCNRLTEISFSECAVISSYAFANCTNLISASFPICNTIGNGAFRACTKLPSICFPVCTRIKYNAFIYCSSLTEASFPKCNYIESGAFSYCSLLREVYFPICNYIESNVFYSCWSLLKVSFPSCSYIGSSAFYSCLSLTEASFSICKYVGNYAFYNCRSLSEVSITMCSYIGQTAFAYCLSLRNISIPSCTYIGAYAFSSCRMLSYVYAPNVSGLYTGTFNGCSILKDAVFPECTFTQSKCFESCTSLEYAYFPKCSNIAQHCFKDCINLSKVILNNCSDINVGGASAFYGCKKLRYLQLEYSSVVRIETISAGSRIYQYIGLTSTPLSAISITYQGSVIYVPTTYNGTTDTDMTFGSIYVPASLISEYQVAPGWSDYASRFAPIPTD